jgi:pyruvate dehydrogenase E2 component (dihydrolipoamide acetyltransferase)
MSAEPTSPTPKMAPWPDIDFAQFGAVEVKPLTKIQRLVGQYLSRNWVMIPHVTHNDLADITALESWRADHAQRSGTKLTPLSFLVKAAAGCLKTLPHFSASLDGTGTKLVIKKYCNIGIAVDSPLGLVVPVIRDADRKSVQAIAAEIIEVTQLARTKGLPLQRMEGGCFTISSLGSIGGTSFTPIINAPEVAIMGVTRSFEQPCKIDGQLAWRTMLPLSLSYDHRVINGADAARFCRLYADALGDPQGLAAAVNA